jgi:hypothetical protein
MAIKDGAAANARIGSVRSCAWGKSWRRQRDRDVETVVRGASETPVARRGRSPRKFDAGTGEAWHRGPCEG